MSNETIKVLNELLSVVEQEHNACQDRITYFLKHERYGEVTEYYGAKLALMTVTRVIKAYLND